MQGQPGWYFSSAVLACVRGIVNCCSAHTLFHKERYANSPYLTTLPTLPYISTLEGITNYCWRWLSSVVIYDSNMCFNQIRMFPQDHRSPLERNWYQFEIKYDKLTLHSGLISFQIYPKLLWIQLRENVSIALPKALHRPKNVTLLRLMADNSYETRNWGKTTQTDKHKLLN